jgi:hypothetical protein
VSAVVAFFSAFEIYIPCPCRHSALETTVAEARIEAPDALTAHQIEVNAEEAHDAAEQAASFAKVRTIISLFISCR